MALVLLPFEDARRFGLSDDLTRSLPDVFEPCFALVNESGLRRFGFFFRSIVSLTIGSFGVESAEAATLPWSFLQDAIFSSISRGMTVVILTKSPKSSFRHPFI